VIFHRRQTGGVSLRDSVDPKGAQCHPKCHDESAVLVVVVVVVVASPYCHVSHRRFVFCVDVLLLVMLRCLLLVLAVYTMSMSSVLLFGILNFI
jgi:hypothetical protein